MLGFFINGVGNSNVGFKAFLILGDVEITGIRGGGGGDGVDEGRRWCCLRLFFAITRLAMVSRFCFRRLAFIGVTLGNSDGSGEENIS